MRYLHVECCAGRRRIPVRLVALDVVELPGPLRCTRCGSVPRELEEDGMPKITVHGGPSDAADIPPPAAEVEPDKVVRAEEAPEPELAEDDTAAGDDPADADASDDRPARKAAKKTALRKATKAA